MRSSASSSSCSETQLQEVVAVSSGNHSARSAVGTSACRDALLLVKDLSFLLKQRMSPYFGKACCTNL